MKRVYNELWKIAKVYYENGRSMDIMHIEWMMKNAIKVCKKEKIDDSLLLPLVILHDVGYAEVSAKNNPYNLDVRKAHMAEGSKIAREILEKVNYPREKIEKIVYYVSVHDSWAFGNFELFEKDIILGTFNDLDFMWMATSEGFPSLMKLLDKNPKELLKFIEENKNKIKAKFSTKTTTRLYEDYIQERRDNLKC